MKKPMHSDNNRKKISGRTENGPAANFDNERSFSTCPGFVSSGRDRVSEQIFTGQLRPMQAEDIRVTPGDALYRGGIAYGSDTAPLWLVAVYKTAGN